MHLETLPQGVMPLSSRQPPAWLLACMPPDIIVPARKRDALNPLLALRPLRLHGDIEVVQPWYQMDYAHYWNMQNMTVDATREFYAQAHAKGEVYACMGLYHHQPAFVMEFYDPAHHALADLYDVQPGDIGMHFFTGPSTQPVRHFTRDVLRAVMAYLFDELHARRVVVEPDIRNSKVQRLNGQVGFVNSTVVELPGKLAQLAFCSPADFTHSLKG